MGSAAVVAGASEEMESRRALKVWLTAWPTISEQFDALVIALRRRELQAPRLLAKQTATFLRNMVGGCCWL